MFVIWQRRIQWYAGFWSLLFIVIYSSNSYISVTFIYYWITVIVHLCRSSFHYVCAPLSNNHYHSQLSSDISGCCSLFSAMSIHYHLPLISIDSTDCWWSTTILQLSADGSLMVNSNGYLLVVSTPLRNISPSTNQIEEHRTCLKPTTTKCSTIIDHYLVGFNLVLTTINHY